MKIEGGKVTLDLEEFDNLWTLIKTPLENPCQDNVITVAWKGKVIAFRADEINKFLEKKYEKGEYLK